MEEKELEKNTPGKTEAENVPENGTGAENTAENMAEPEGAAVDGENAPETGKEEKKEKKGLFGKKKDPRDTQIEELTDQLKRSMAEFDNYRKRTDKEKSAMYEIGARDVIDRSFLWWIILNEALPPFPRTRRKHPLPKEWRKYINSI